MEFIDLKKQYGLYQEELEEAALKVLRSGRYILGPEVKELEEKLADFVGVKYALGVSSGTDALLLILKALELGPQDAIITTPFTFVATAEVIRRVGARVIFADIDPKTFLLSPETLAEALEKARKKGLRIRAVIAVSLFGLPAYLPELEAFCEKEGLFLIEDACQSLGAECKGRKSGSFGIASATSFFPAKPLGAYGDAGMVFTNDETLYHKIEALRVHGQTERYLHQYQGLNARLDTLQAALLLVKLKYYSREIELRQKVAQRYRKYLEDLPVEFQSIPEGCRSVYAQFTLRIPKRDDLVKFLAERDIPTAIHYPRPLHLQPAFKELGYHQGDFPQAEKLAQEVISLPMHPFLERGDQGKIAEAIGAFYGSNFRKD
ncbi:DegT/DnrJ/EryC1/StrS family aminotransferase [Thermodesulfatator autotrophicus]|uniref:Aminotransferase DegT n=1 Tax=Thermodesulfatator autotrophicus TaxID=1795632 RepID=A0A177E907_9BACT|nr:DegT/DnrJ/EryC1/StrS family aminotransferase [Thermodesulfatator autotrophicus]OAG27702.1 aminotransferase DegT [Thermodesulfatator autotrophicus]